MNPNNATKFINVSGYTDVDSYAVLADNGNSLVIQKVKRDFKPEMVPGGFSAVCVNISEQRKAPLLPDGPAFMVERRKDGKIGMWKDDILFDYNTSDFVEGALPGLLAKNPNWRVQAGKVYVYAGFRKDGTPKRKWVSFPEPTDTCRAFYDYNF